MTVDLAVPSQVVDLLTVLAIFACAYLIYRFAVARLIDRIAKASGVESGVASFWKYVALAIVMLMAGALSAPLIGERATVAYFAIGLVLGTISSMLVLGLKDVLVNAFSGYALMVYKPFRRGDMVVIDDELGYVRDITAVYTEIVREDGVYYVPNSELMKKSFLMKPLDALSKLTIDLKVKGDVDVDVVEQLIKDAVKQCKEVATTPEPEVYLREIGEGSLTIRIAARLANPRKTLQVRSQILKAIKYSFEKAGIKLL